MRFAIAGVVCVVLLGVVTAQAQTTAPPIPAEKSLKLSEIIAKIEQLDQFRYIDEID